MELSFKNVSKNYGGIFAVDDITYTMETGVYGLLGVNGAGKTTLMKMLCTVTRPTAGEIRWNGEDIFRLEERYRDLLGYLPQDFGYYPNLSVSDYMMYIASIKGIRPAVARKRMKELLEMVGLSRYKNRKMKALSGGMARRVGIAQAMLNNPKILVLDEPTAGLDPKGRDEIFEQIAQMHEENHMTIILVSHSMEDVAQYVSRMIVMNQGEIVSDGTPSSVFSHYKELEQIGLAAPQVTYLLHEMKEAEFDVSTSAVSVEDAEREILRCLGKGAWK